MSEFCKYQVEFKTQTGLVVNEVKHDAYKLIRVDVAVTFYSPRNLDHRKMPSPCVPSSPGQVGNIADVKLTYGMNINQSGDWVFSIVKDTTGGVFLGNLRGYNSNTATWQFTFKIPPNAEWKNVTADYILFPPYENRACQDNCAYYSSDSGILVNTHAVFSGKGLTSVVEWENPQLPVDEYDCVFLDAGTFYSISVHGRIENVKIASPIDDINPYVVNYDYTGGYRNNLFEIVFKEPGVYAAKINYDAGSYVLFFAVGSILKTMQPTTQRLTLGRMRRIVDVPNSSAGCSLFISEDNKLLQFEENIITGLQNINSADGLVNAINAAFQESNRNPLTVLLSTHGQGSDQNVPGSIELDGDWLYAQSGTFGYVNQCIGVWELDRIINGYYYKDDNGVTQHATGLKGGANNVHLWCCCAGGFMDSACNILKYIAEGMVTGYGPAVCATTYGWDCALFAVKAGSVRDGYYLVLDEGNYVSYTATGSYTGAGILPQRAGTPETPNFYGNK